MNRMLAACLLGAVLSTTSCVYRKSTSGVSYPAGTSQEWSPGAPVTVNRTPPALSERATPAGLDLPSIRARGFLLEDQNTCSEK